MNSRDSGSDSIDINEPTYPNDTPDFRDINNKAYAAYYKVLDDLIAQYGIRGDNWDDIGLFRAALVDLDGDGVDSLVIFYFAEHYYTQWQSLVRNGGYFVYGYDRVLNTAYLRHHDPAEENSIPSLYSLSIFRGQDGLIYLKARRNHNGYDFRDYHIIEQNVWITVLSYEVHYPNEEDDTYYIDGNLVSEDALLRRINEFESELIFGSYKYAFGDIPDDFTKSNILEILRMLAE
jgi:hypothetical protein